ncbi:MAG: NAD(P)-dependent oxidoreductase, partial [Neisseria sp.]|nr:NAD(P)-dependent oxidoreductase [Neisseria sp.]
MKKAIVTGATGGLGRNLVQTLLAQDWQVAACGRNAEIGKMLGTEFHAFDLSDRNQTLKAFSEADIVFHCAALSSPWGRYEDFYRANVTATQNVLAAIRHHHIGKLIHVSTPSIYFDYLDQHKVPETFVSRHFVNDYAYTKFLAEQEVAAATDISSVIIRPRGIFGEYDTAVLPRLLKISERGFLPLIRRCGREAGGALVDVTYVGNVVHALMLAAEVDAPRAMPFNITNGEPQTIATL